MPQSMIYMTSIGPLVLYRPIRRSLPYSVCCKVVWTEGRTVISFDLFINLLCNITDLWQVSGQYCNTVLHSIELIMNEHMRVSLKRINTYTLWYPFGLEDEDNDDLSDVDIFGDLFTNTKSSTTFNQLSFQPFLKAIPTTFPTRQRLDQLHVISQTLLIDLHIVILNTFALSNYILSICEKTAPQTSCLQAHTSNTVQNSGTY